MFGVDVESCVLLACFNFLLCELFLSNMYVCKGTHLTLSFCDIFLIFLYVLEFLCN